MKFWSLWQLENGFYCSFLFAVFRNLLLYVFFVAFFFFLSVIHEFGVLVAFPRLKLNLFLPVLLVFHCLFLARQRTVSLCWFRYTVLLLSASIVIISVVWCVCSFNCSLPAKDVVEIACEQVIIFLLSFCLIIGTSHKETPFGLPVLWR
jgi:hypothetical protein